MRSYQKAFLCYVQAAKVSPQCRTAIHFMTLETFYDWVCNMYNFVLSVLYALKCFSSPIVNRAKVHFYLQSLVLYVIIESVFGCGTSIFIISVCNKHFRSLSVPYQKKIFALKILLQYAINIFEIFQKLITNE